ncbi:hypothetical protein [Chitinophaga sp. Cy-1792]|uniref:hypothetical protein n=1 Tax=Chitinophaga sp. Cy-1792 TaxID=2608339 RepID=UPI0014246348|nr:hypothetical protein [Chitinophaga sp. Cy-1792]NIG57618.1 hypothetical protein [Chitinophaga sp. Cy-1792]
MEMLALTCPQCGSSDVKLIPERNDLAQCNYCNALFMLPPPSITEEAKPKTITAAEEEVDMTEVVYPTEPDHPSFVVFPYVVSVGLILVGLIGEYFTCFIATGKLAANPFFGYLSLILIGMAITGVIMEHNDKKQKQYTDRMQEYNEALSAANKKKEAQDKRRGLQRELSEK